MAYNLATIVQKDAPADDGRVHIVVAFTGNAGEPRILRDKYIAGESIADIRAWARAEAATLLGKKTVADLLALNVTLDLTPPAGPTAAQIAQAVWLEKAQRLVRMRELALTNATAVTNFNALVADVNATYLAAYAAVT